MTNIIKNKTILLAAIKNKFAVCNLQFVICISLLTANCLLPTFSFAQPVWSQPSDPSTSVDYAYAITADATSIYVAGFNGSPTQWRIEKRNKSDGVLDATFDGDGIVESNPSAGSDVAYAITIDATSIYIAGSQWVASGATTDSQWRIEKRNKTDGSLTWAQTSNPYVNTSYASDEYARAITVDASGVYVAGHYASGGASSNYGWRIEKRDLGTGTYDATFGGGSGINRNPGTGDDRAMAITIDASGIFTTGYYNNAGNLLWQIEKRDLSDGTLVSGFGSSGVVTGVSATEIPYGITIDASGIYVAGYDAAASSRQWRIEKRNLTSGAYDGTFGSGFGYVQSNPSGEEDIPYAITADANGLYIAGFDETPSATNRQWRIEQRNLTTGELTTCFTTSDLSTAEDAIYAIIADDGLYVVGISQPSDYEWHMKKYPGLPPCVLPIELLSFSASCSPSPALPPDKVGINSGKGVVLQWSTASEMNNDYFTIERASAPPNLPKGEEFEFVPIGTVKGAGNSSTIRNYEFVDQLGTWDLGLGTWYYRLQQTDYDGKYEYFGPISVNLNNCDANTINVFPNPSSGEFAIQLATGNWQLASSQQPAANIAIYNVLGEKVFTSTINHSAFQDGIRLSADQPLTIDISSHPDGIYFLRIKTEKEIITRKIIIQK